MLPVETLAIASPNAIFTETVTDCVYKVDMLGGVTCHEAVTEVFSNYGENNAIPDVEFFRSYLDAEVTEPIPEELTALDYLMNGFTDYIIHSFKFR